MNAPANNATGCKLRLKAPATQYTFPVFVIGQIDCLKTFRGFYGVAYTCPNERLAPNSQYQDTSDGGGFSPVHRPGLRNDGHKNPPVRHSRAYAPCGSSPRGSFSSTSHNQNSSHAGLATHVPRRPHAGSASWTGDYSCHADAKP